MNNNCDSGEHQQATTCLNCGNECNGRFCANCGQPTNTGRISNRTFFGHVIMGTTRVSKLFLITCFGLMIHPWKVIKEYIYGHRIKYVAPVSLLIILVLYLAIIRELLHIEPKIAATGIGTQWPWNLITGSATLQFITFSIPIAISTYIAYFKDIRHRFSFAELMIAAIYSVCTLLIYDSIICIPLEYINSSISDVAIICIIITFCVTSLCKAFPQPSVIKTILRLLWWGLLSNVSIIAFNYIAFIGGNI